MVQQLTTGPKVCVVIPTYNERENIRPLVTAIKEAEIPELQVLFVDDSSPDGTSEEVRAVSGTEPWVHLLTREAKKGIGSAYLDGFRFSVANLDPQIVLEMDADLQHPPGVIGALVRAVDGGADVAVASRYVEGGGVAGWSWSRRVVSSVANRYVRVLLGLRVKDCTSGFRAFNLGAIQTLLASDLPTTGFEFQVGVLLALKTGVKIVEVPFTFQPRKAGVSKLGLRDMFTFAIRVARMAI